MRFIAMCSLVLALAGCSSKPAPKPAAVASTPPPAADAAPAAAPAANACDWNRPDFDKKGPIQQHEGELTLEEPGREPRAIRLYRKPAAARATFKAHKQSRMRTVFDGAAPEVTVVPPLDYDVEWTLTSMDNDGIRTFDFRVADVVATGPAQVPPSWDGEGTPEETAAILTQGDRALVGQTFTFAAAPSGAFESRAKDPGQFADPAYMLVPFPDQPIGVGAVWGRTNTVSGGMTVNTRYRVRLLEVAGDRLRVGFELTQERLAFRQFLSDGTPQEYTMTMTVRGEAEVDLAGPPVAASWQSTTRMDLAQCKDSILRRSTMEAQIDWTWRRK